MGLRQIYSTFYIQYYYKNLQVIEFANLRNICIVLAGYLHLQTVAELQMAE